MIPRLDERDVRPGAGMVLRGYVPLVGLALVMIFVVVFVPSKAPTSDAARPQAPQQVEESPEGGSGAKGSATTTTLSAEDQLRQVMGGGASREGSGSAPSDESTSETTVP